MVRDHDSAETSELAAVRVLQLLAVSPVGAYDTKGQALGVAVSGHYAYVTDWSRVLQVIDVSDPAKPQWVGGSDTAPESRDVAVSGNYAYVAAGTNGLRIFAVGPTRARFPLTSLETLPGGAFGFRVSGEPGQHLELQASEDFGAWTTIDTVTNIAGHTDLTDPANGRDRRFYRLRLKE